MEELNPNLDSDLLKDMKDKISTMLLTKNHDKNYLLNEVPYIVDADEIEFLKLGEKYPELTKPTQLDTYETEPYQTIKYNIENQLESIIENHFNNQ